MEHAASSAAAAGSVRTRRTVLDLLPARVLARSIAFARERDACAFECVARCTAALAGLSSSATPPLVVQRRLADADAAWIAAREIVTQNEQRELRREREQAFFRQKREEKRAQSAAAEAERAALDDDARAELEAREAADAEHAALKDRHMRRLSFSTQGSVRGKRASLLRMGSGRGRGLS